MTTPGMERRESDDGVAYRLDQRDYIVEVDERWRMFARANEAPELADGVLGRSLWDFITDSTTATMYRDLLVHVREGRRMTFPFRCDAPSLRRWMRMTMTPLAGREVLFETETVERKPADAPLWDRHAGRGAQLTVVCSWCKQVKIDDHRWAETDAAIDSMQLFLFGPLPMLTHGMCPRCYAAMMETLADDPRARG